MTDSLRKLILEQINATSDIKRILINYKKLAKANITLAKTKSRLAELRRCEKMFDTAIMISFLWQQRRIGRSCLTSLKKNTTQDAYNQASDHLQEAIEVLVTPSNSASYSNTDPVDDEPQSSAVTLQRIPIPTFSGEFAEWPRFRHLFHSLVHSNTAL
ncbi:hypothetical protein HN011_005922 [Eciton burchellii]|nr:hypothetical protein HN011_005922 [Eciton burchellii]